MNHTRTSTKAAALLVFGLTVLVACGDTRTTTNSTANASKSPANAPTAPSTPASTPTGPTTAAVTSKHPIQLFADTCAACHKETGKGGKMTVEGKTINPDDLTSAKMAAKTDEQLYKYIADGIPDEGMPAFKDKLSEYDIKNLVTHIRYLQKSSTQ